MNTTVLFVIPIVSAFIGWLGLKLAFRYAIQKSIVARKASIARGLGSYVRTELIQLDKLTAQLSDPAAFEALKPMIASHVDDFLQVRLKEKSPCLQCL